jgi:predicted enzyme related to lactoylglutathione lyase
MRESDAELIVAIISPRCESQLRGTIPPPPFNHKGKRMARKKKAARRTLQRGAARMWVNKKTQTPIKTTRKSRASKTKASAPAAPPSPFVWHEVNTRQPEAAARFYAEMFGWGTTQQDMGGFQYTMFTRNGKHIGGVMPMIGPEWPPEMRPHWMVYVGVDDIDAACQKAVMLGGRVCVPPTDIAVGRFAVLDDPTGATISVFQPKM